MLELRVWRRRNSAASKNVGMNGVGVISYWSALVDNEVYKKKKVAGGRR